MCKLGSSVILEGWHGQLNAGDDAFAMVIAERMRRHGHDQPLVIYEDVSGCMHKKVGLTVACTPTTSRLRLKGIYWRYLLWRATGRILGGGSLFGAHFAKPTSEWWERRGLPSVAIGVSVGPFASRAHETGVLRYLEKFDFVAFRDNDSAAWATQRGLNCNWVEAFDLAVLMKGDLPAADSVAAPLVGVSLAGLSSLANNQCRVDSEWFHQAASTIVRVARTRGARIRCFNLCANPRYTDAPVYEVFRRAGAKENEIELFAHDGDPDRTLRAVAACSHFISSRLHGGIFAFIANVPTIFLSYHTKCRQFARSVGFSDEYFFDCSDVNWSQFAETMDGLLQSRQGFSAKRRLSDVVPLAEQNFRFCAE